MTLPHLCYVWLVVVLGSAVLAHGDGGPRAEPLEYLERDEGLARMLLLDYLAGMDPVRTAQAPPEQDLGLAGGLRRRLALSHRERKAGCRNFFWKTFTSC